MKETTLPSSKLKVEMLAELSKYTVIPKEHEDYVIDALIKAFNSIPMMLLVHKASVERGTNT